MKPEIKVYQVNSSFLRNRVKIFKTLTEEGWKHCGNQQLFGVDLVVFEKTDHSCEVYD